MPVVSKSDSSSVDTFKDNMPVIIGVAAISQKTENLELSREALKLMQSAVESAAVDAGNTSLLQQIDEISIPQGFWSYTDPARLIASAVGSPKAKTCLAGIGVLQQSLINKACQKIVNGENQLTVIVGGEAKYRSLQAKIQGVSIVDTLQENNKPDLHWTSDDPIWSELEAERGLFMPAEFFALMESALCSERSVSIEQHRAYLGRLYEVFSDIAHDNPDAWSEEKFSADEISEPTEKNPYLAFPYTKRQNSQWNVDQAAAIIICSAKKARELGIPEQRWVYPLSGAESNYSTSLSERPVLHRHKGTDFSVKAAMKTAGLTVDQIDFFELYSCFPAVIQSHALDIGVSDQQAWTQTGGMAYAGGPLNNFVIQATVKMIQTIRDHPDTKGLVSCISGINAKQGIGVYASSVPVNAYVTTDVTEKTRKAMPIMPCISEYEGEAVILASTVVYHKGGASHAFVIAEAIGEMNGKRLVVSSKDLSVMQRLTENIESGEKIFVGKNGNFTF